MKMSSKSLIPLLYVVLTSSCVSVKAQHPEIQCLQLVAHQVDSILRLHERSLAEFDGWVRLKFNAHGHVTECKIEKTKTLDKQLDGFVQTYFLEQAPDCLWATYGKTHPNAPDDEILICVCLGNLD